MSIVISRIELVRIGFVLACVSSSTILTGCKKKPVPPSESPLAPVPNAADVCRQLIGASRRNLDATCTPEERKRPAYAYLSGLVEARIEECRAALTPGLLHRQLELDEGKLAACASELTKASWKQTLSRPLVQFSACRSILVGTASAGAMCQIDAECTAGSFCEESRRMCRTTSASGDECHARRLEHLDGPTARAARAVRSVMPNPSADTFWESTRHAQDR